MPEQVTLIGFIGTDPRYVTTSEGTDILSFRLACGQGHFDQKLNKWVDGLTNWYKVTAFRRLAANGSQSLAKGQRVVVTGRLKIEEWKTSSSNGVTVEVTADAIGHDLSLGRSVFTRVVAPGREWGAAVDSGDAADLGTGMHNGGSAETSAEGSTQNTADPAMDDSTVTPQGSVPF